MEKVPSRRLPEAAAQSTRDYHDHVDDEEKAKIVEVAEQDPQHVLLHTTDAGDPYYIGDIYDDEKCALIAREWSIDPNEKENPYLLHIKTLSKSWPHLRYLADFMEVSTEPLRWKFLDPSNGGPAIQDRNLRAERTNVARLDFFADGTIRQNDFKSGAALKTSLDALGKTTQTSSAASEIKTETEDTPVDGEDPTLDESTKVQFRLFVVEDLSRLVIEALGSKFDIDPSFFREHINDYAWFNVRDRFAEAPNLQIITENQPWFQVRWARARYFRTNDSFEKAKLQAGRFNVLRRPDPDMNNGALLDDPEAIVALSRTRASFWRGKFEGGDIGILLLDPTVSEGFPLWRHYRNWDPIPSMHAQPPYAKGPPDNASLFEIVIHWTMKEYFPSPNLKKASNDLPIVPVQAFLHIVCAEWLTMISYLSTRLGQLEWEIAFPRDFSLEEAADSSLKKLHVWRRLIPLYREMITETLSDRVFQFPPHHAHNQKLPFHALKPSFRHVLTKFDELQSRLDRLTTIATAAISIAETRQTFVENKNLKRLTWLATVFIPLTFITGLLSIQPDIPSLKGSLKYFFAIAIPLTVITLGITAVTTIWGEWIVAKVTGREQEMKKRRAIGGTLKFHKDRIRKNK